MEGACSSSTVARAVSSPLAGQQLGRGAPLFQRSRRPAPHAARARAQAWPERALLLCLCEDGVSAHRLPSLALACQAARTRGAGRFALDAPRDMLAVALKRRLLLLHFNGNEFAEAKELGLPDAALALGWCGGSVCLGFKRECGPPFKGSPARPLTNAAQLRTYRFVCDAAVCDAASASAEVAVLRPLGAAHAPGRCCGSGCLAFSEVAAQRALQSHPSAPPSTTP